MKIFSIKRNFIPKNIRHPATYILAVIFFVAAFGDFLANEKPIIAKINGKILFPILMQYAVDAGWMKWEAHFLQKNWREHPYEFAIFPPIPYSAHTLDSKNNNFKSPFGHQNVTHLRYRHWLGTDQLGRDVAAGLIAGTRVGVWVGLLAMGVAALIGIAMGSLAGFFGDNSLRVSSIRIMANAAAVFFAWFYGFSTQPANGAENGALTGSLMKSLLIIALVFGIFNAFAYALGNMFPSLQRHRVALPLDTLVMRLIEAVNSIPVFLMLLAFAAILQKNSLFHVMLIIGLIRWTGVARFLRAELLKVRETAYMESARALGYSAWRRWFYHALPNAITPVIITFAFGTASAILLESSLSFLGIGAAENNITWGKILAEARRYPAAWWLAVFPGVAIFVTVTSLNLLGEYLQNRRRE